MTIKKFLSILQKAVREKKISGWLTKFGTIRVKVNGKGCMCPITAAQKILRPSYLKGSTLSEVLFASRIVGLDKFSTEKIVYVADNSQESIKTADRRNKVKPEFILLGGCLYRIKVILDIRKKLLKVFHLKEHSLRKAA
jgi:CO dehydrogenase nickel-insertion accessory protein CooC1